MRSNGHEVVVTKWRGSLQWQQALTKQWWYQLWR